jgi:hypothetical protein
MVVDDFHMLERTTGFLRGVSMAAAHTMGKSGYRSSGWIPLTGDQDPLKDAVSSCGGRPVSGGEWWTWDLWRSCVRVAASGKTLTGLDWHHWLLASSQAQGAPVDTD